MSTAVLIARIAQQLVGAAAGLATGLLTARWLGPDGKGLLAVVLLVSTIASQAATLGLHDGASFLRNRGGFALKHLLRLFDLGVVSWGVSVSVLIASLMHFAGLRIWAHPIPLELAAVAGLLVLAKLSGLLMKGLLLAERRFKAVATLDFADGALPGLILLGIATFRPPTVLNIAVSFLAGASVVALAARLTAGAAVQPDLNRPRPALTPLLACGIWTYARQMGQIAIARGDVLIVGALLGVRAVGLYAVALTLCELLARVPDAVGWMLLPQAASLADPDARALTARCAKWSLYLTALAAVPYGCVASLLIEYWLPAFKESAILLVWLLPGLVASSLTRAFGADLVGRGKAARIAKVTWLMATAIFVLDVMLVSRFGLIGVAAIATGIQILGAFLILLMYSDESGLSYRHLLIADIAELNAVRTQLRLPLTDFSFAAVFRGK